jgi:hypothetical protein
MNAATGLQIIGFAGPQDSGKDEAADELARQIRSLGCRSSLGGIVTSAVSTHAVRRFALAQTLRDMADAGRVPQAATRAAKDQPCPELGGATGRDLLIALGRAMRQVAGEEYLGRCLVEQARDWANIRSRAWAVVSDVRTMGDVRALKAAGARLIWVHRPGRVVDAMLEGEVCAQCHAVLMNDGTLAELHAKVADLARGLVG